MNDVQEDEPKNTTTTPHTARSPGRGSTHDIDLPSDDKSLELEMPSDDKAEFLSARSDARSEIRSARRSADASAKQPVSATAQADPSHANIGSETARSTASKSNKQASSEGTTVPDSKEQGEPVASMTSSRKDLEVLDECMEKPANSQRNVITGSGLGEDGVGGIKPKKLQTRRDGNPLTGEGYESGNGGNLVINRGRNRNRIPPGGFSSGLW